MPSEAKEAQISAMLHIEVCIGEIDAAILEMRAIDIDLLLRRLWAAEYIVQSMNGGPKPYNYAEVTTFPEDDIGG